MRIRYGLQWPDELDDLKVEMHCIRSGGIWKQSGMTVGNGLSFHYERMRQILWPHLDDHRWNSLCRDEIIKNKVTVLMGCASSGKTHAAAWIYLCEYFCFPQDTCVLVSSTDIRGLELRVWGEIKNLHEQAKANYDYLPGYLIDSKHCISTDSIDEGQARDLRRGLIGIPTISNGKYIGLSKWVGVKQKRMRLIADECFPAGSLVEGVPIESISPGDYVLTAAGRQRVIACSRSTTKDLVVVHCKDGRSITCTPNHPIFTNQGWKKACELNQHHYMLSVYESMQIMREANEEQSFLRFALQRELAENSRGESHFLHQGAQCENTKREAKVVSGASREIRRNVSGAAGCDGALHEWLVSVSETGAAGENQRRHEKAWGKTSNARRERHWANESREVATKRIPRVEEQFSCSDTEEKWQRIPDMLQGGCGIPRIETGNRSRRGLTPAFFQATAGHQENQPTDGAWVDRVEVYQQANTGGHGKRAGGIEVYNLQVEGHPSYSVHGFLVHNCQFMGASFLSAFSNLDKNEDFRAIVLGNPNDIMDPLGKAAEPREGWASHLEPTKTEVWDTRFMNGRCVNLIGLDSPNFDYPANEPTRFKYLISREKIANTVSFFPKDSIEYYSQCVGAMKIGVLARRVLTRDMCRQFHACDPVIWKGTPTVKIGALDAAYGGDRCVLGCIEFGEDVRGRQTIMVYPPVIVPISVKVDKIPEDQIADYVRLYCDSRGIKPENFFYDSTGRGSLGTSFARIWSNKVNPLEFGGTPTDRPVASDLYIQDAKGGRRLKLCSEHYRKFVTELWFSVRYAIEADQMRGLSEDVMEEGCMREWDTTKDDKKELETKLKMKERTGRSPDLMDQLAIAVEGARQRGFQIRMLVNTVARGSNAIEDFLDAKRKKHKELQKKQQLNYA